MKSKTRGKAECGTGGGGRKKGKMRKRNKKTKRRGIGDKNEDKVKKEWKGSIRKGTKKEWQRTRRKKGGKEGRRLPFRQYDAFSVSRTAQRREGSGRGQLRCRGRLAYERATIYRMCHFQNVSS
jgi:hypothetical protein